MELNSGDIIADVLREQGVKFVFTLCGGHISPLLVGAKKNGIRVVDVRDEANAVFAADAVARLKGNPGVAAVTAGPGVTNTITALKNAQMAQSPVILLGGAAPTVLKNRGALQDIDQLSLVKSIAKLSVTIRRNCDIIPVMKRAFQVCQSGVPGPVFIECPIDLMYSEELVREWYGKKPNADQKPGLKSRLLEYYLRRHVDQMFECKFEEMAPGQYSIKSPDLDIELVSKAAVMISASEKPAMIVGSQAMLHADEVHRLVDAFTSLGIPVYLTGMARGLMGKSHPLLMRHQRKEALKQADLVLVAGMPFDFRLNYGRAIGGRARVISVNRSKADLTMNRRPDLGVLSDPFLFLCALPEALGSQKGLWDTWVKNLRANDDAREHEIQDTANEKTEYLNPVLLLSKMDDVIDDQSIIVADGGDFVATASYTLRPRGPLSWLDPGVFGTLGVGAGFSLGSKLCHPEKEIWLIYGDGAAGYTLQEFDTFVRHELPVIAIVGNDAGWTQIARDQIPLFNDDVATQLRYTDYHIVAEGFGGKGFLLDNPEDIDEVFRQAKETARSGTPVLVNARIGKTDFRKGSISM
ncbi:MAG: thiamine pyrophosphate-binding protein [Desulfobacterales bacterium]|jgi:acetolactate synthase-1/2/3 large subunit